MSVTLQQYEQAERQEAAHQAAVGLWIHVAVTALVWAALIPINVLVAPEFPWSIFVVLGTGLGVSFHWFGYRRADVDIRRKQERIEARARDVDMTEE
jgi:fatty acid desaturase